MSLKKSVGGVHSKKVILPHFAALASMELSGGCFMDDSITPSTGLPSTGLTGPYAGLTGALRAASLRALTGSTGLQALRGRGGPDPKV